MSRTDPVITYVRREIERARNPVGMSAGMPMVKIPADHAAKLCIMAEHGLRPDIRGGGAGDPNALARESFERLHPIPPEAVWCEGPGVYRYKSSQTVCHPINSEWEAFEDGVLWQSIRAEQEKWRGNRRPNCDRDADIVLAEAANRIEQDHEG